MKTLLFALCYEKDQKKFHFIAPEVLSFTQSFNHLLKIFSEPIVLQALGIQR